MTLPKRAALSFLARVSMALLIVLCTFNANASSAQCESAAPGPVVKDVETTSVYMDRQSSVVDESRKKQNSIDVAPIDRAALQIAEMSNKYVTGDDCSGMRALQLLSQWASGDGLSHPVGFQGQVTSMLYGMSFVSSFGQSAELCRDADCDRTKRWLAMLADQSLIYFSASGRKRNNLFYWSSAFAVFAGRYTGRNALYERGKAGLTEGFSHIGPDGFTYENDRGKRALFYNAYAFTALTWGAAGVSREWMLEQAAANPNIAKMRTRLNDYRAGKYDRSLYSTPQEVVHFPYWQLPWQVAGAASTSEACKAMDNSLRHKVLGGSISLMLSRLWHLPHCASAK